MSANTKNRNLFEALAAIQRETAEIEKRAEVGGTTHPVENEDDNTKPATEGSFSSEQSTEVKSLYPLTGEGRTEATKKQEDVQPQQGIKKTELGDDPAVEKDYKMTTTDPGTEHPARFDTEKYSSEKVADLADFHTKLANAILADLVNGQNLTSKAASAPAPVAPVAPVADTNYAAGYEIAKALGIEKKAAEASVRELATSITADAVNDAALFADFLSGLQKAAADEAEEPDDDDDEDDSTEPPVVAEESAAPAATGAADMADMGDMGAPPAGGDMGAAPDMGGLGAPPAGDMGGDPMGGAPASEEEAIAELVAALQELGITPEDLAAASQPDTAAGMPMDPAAGGGLPPELAGGMPPMGPSEGMKLAAAAKRYQRSGRYEIKAAAAGSRERLIRDQMKSYVREIIAA